MKRIIVAIALVMATTAAMAQNGQWTKPQEQPSMQQRQQERQKPANPDTDPKYLAGAVPEVDGRIVFSKTIAAPGKSASEVYTLMLQRLQQLTHEEDQIQSQVAIVNQTAREIGATFEEWLVFKKNALVLDRSRFYYTVHVACKDGSADVTINRLRYLYEEERDPQKYNAEEWISDREALNKTKTKLVRMSAKFRRKTVDRMEQLFNEFTKALQ
ncbi:MAG: DUF4468 domain-containing protein [Prevotella sp.]|nr:DUF4468 domain-containing protein [Prevotella sp.]